VIPTFAFLQMGATAGECGDKHDYASLDKYPDGYLSFPIPSEAISVYQGPTKHPLCRYRFGLAFAQCDHRQGCLLNQKMKARLKFIGLKDAGQSVPWRISPNNPDMVYCGGNLGSGFYEECRAGCFQNCRWWCKLGKGIIPFGIVLGIF